MTPTVGNVAVDLTECVDTFQNVSVMLGYSGARSVLRRAAAMRAICTTTPPPTWLLAILTRIRASAKLVGRESIATLLHL
jgi:hypothetical protein